MANDETNPRLTDGQRAAVVLIAGGILLLAASFLWPGHEASSANWSTEQAEAYRDASIRFHALSHQSGHVADPQSERAIRAKLAQVEAQYDVLRDQLDSAIDRPKKISLLLRISGFLLTAAGAAVLYKRANS